MNIDPRDAMPPEQLEMLSRAFSEQLLACLDECARGRTGLFSELIDEEDKKSGLRRRGCASWRLRCKAFFGQQEERNALCDEFLDLCTIHGESHPGERKLARTFLERIERGEVGAPTDDKRPW